VRRYFGHTYVRTGRFSVAARLVWTGQFRVGTGAWQDIPGAVESQAASLSVWIREARGVLIPNP
jgi:hypothetical protein